MFSRVRKQIGAALVFIGFIFVLGLAGTDDVHTLQGVHNPTLSVFVHILLSLVIMATGVLLAAGGDSDEDTL